MPQQLTEMIELRVARWIRARRLTVGMTQQQLAGTSVSSFNRRISTSARISRISARRLYRIATALQTPIEYFFTPDDDEGKRKS